MPDKSPEKISAMFDQIAPTYDYLNHAFTLNLDRKWRKLIIREIQHRQIPARRILDLATGTGDLAIELVRLVPDVLIAADFSREMLDFQRKFKSNRNIELVHADAANLPFEENSFDIVTIGFGVRNFYELEKCLKEIKRVMNENGRMIILEMFRGNGIMNDIFNFYFNRVMPRLGNMISGSSNAYSYLSESVIDFYSVEEFCTICESLDLIPELTVNNFLGIVNTIYFKKLS